MNKIIILGHENPDVDSIVSGYLLQKILNQKGYTSKFIIPDEKIESQTLHVCRKYGLDPIQYKEEINFNNKDNKYILVDHHQRELDGEIIAIIDHHPTLKNINLNNYYNKNISSTACYISNGNEEYLNENDLELAIAATMVDTASFHSTKSREEDKNWVIDLCKKYNFDYEKLYTDGLCLTPLNDIENVYLNGLKKYEFSSKRVESSYIQIEDYLGNEDKINKIVDKLINYLKEVGLDYFIFIVHDMKEFKTMYYLISEDAIEKKYYEKYTSRGSTIIPEFEEELLKQKSI